ncbi:MAG: hypothetical protein D8M26_00730 [Ignavibacteriae bacterium]|nr:hypothetical protein [Ignavibacteriota bacterium]
MNDKKTNKLICPYHQKELVLKEAKTGINRGTKFWGCPTWSRTACNYTLPYETYKNKKLSLKKRIELKIRNKRGKISVLKIVGQILLLPIYILGLGAAMTAKVFSSKRKMGL